MIDALPLLIDCTTPFLIGVRHHSPALALAIPTLLDTFSPDQVLIELPVELEPWLPYLGHPDAEAPLALAASRMDTGDLGFYPFADFSPELAAVRWAVQKGVPVATLDLPMAARLPEEEEALSSPPPGLLAAVLGRAGVADGEDLWDTLVEARAPGASPEAIRRAGLYVGWLMREDTATTRHISRFDQTREAHMRHVLAAQKGRTAVVVGAFHTPALLPTPLRWTPPEPIKPPKKPPEVKTSLLPYTFELLDARSGYPAGIRDPRWRQRVWAVQGAPAAVEAALTEVVVEVCQTLRQQRHVAGVPDAREAVRMALDLARLRGLPAAGRRELLESVEAALGHGEVIGRGRVLARALEPAMVGDRRGKLAPGTPRSGLGPHVEALLQELGLPGPNSKKDDKPRDLSPLRSDIDRRRHVTLMRLGACGIPYGTPRKKQGVGGAEALGWEWTVEWTPATDALIEIAGTRGVTLAQAAEGTLRAELRKAELAEALTGAVRLQALEAAAEAGLPALVREGLIELMGRFATEASLTELVTAINLMERVEHGLIPGLPTAGEGSRPGSPGAVEAFTLPPGVERGELVRAAVRAVEGLAGSDTEDDARALAELTLLMREAVDGWLGDSQLDYSLANLEISGSPLMQGAAGMARVLLGRAAASALGLALGAAVDGAIDLDSRRALSRRLTGALVVAGPVFEGLPDLCGGVAERVEAQRDADFLSRLPALRAGFEALSPAARGRLLEVLAARLGVEITALNVDIEAAVAGTWAAADHAGRQAVLALGLPIQGEAPALPSAHPPTSPLHSISPLDRWRLVLGQEREKLSSGLSSYARALEELYGRGRGEGARDHLGGGQETAFPTVREWANEVEALFGAEVREEVLGQAVDAGRRAALMELDPDTVTPSVELLRDLLALKGGLAPDQYAHLRKLVARVVKALAESLAIRVRPALTGIGLPRPTRRPTGRLDLRRTVAANLKTAVWGPEGYTLVPERLVFRTRARKDMDWHLILVVDVSGSMEVSVIWSSIMAAILAGLPALSVDFLAFSTEVVDLSERVDDPLGLLLEVSVGGGTHIAKGLRAARERLRVPRRTMVVVVTDFEEGWPLRGLLAEVRTLAEAGVRLLGLAALDDHGAPRYARATAEQVVAAGMPVAALTPLELARWVREQMT